MDIDFFNKKKLKINETEIFISVGKIQEWKEICSNIIQTLVFQMDNITLAP